MYTDAIEGFLFGGVGTLLAVVSIPTDQMVHAFLIGIAGGCGGLLVKLVQWKIKKIMKNKSE